MKILIIGDDLNTVTMLTTLLIDYIPELSIATIPLRTETVEAISPNVLDAIILTDDTESPPIMKAIL